MKKFLPIAFGLMIGIIGAKLSWPAAIGFFCIAQFFFLGWLLQQNYKPPGELTLCPDRTLIDEAGRNTKLLRQEGFLATAKMDVDGATVIAFSHPELSLVGYVFQTNTLPAKVSFNFASRIGGGKASLTTSQGPTLISTPEGFFEQTFPKATIEVLLEEHIRAQKFLSEHGVEFDQIGHDDLSPESLRKWQTVSNEARLSVMKKSPVSSIILSFFRALGAPNPRKRRVEDQPDVLARLKA